MQNDAEPCLRNLSGLYPLALLTNGTPDLQWEKIETTGISKYFVRTVVSGEFGYGKPDRRIFKFLLIRLKVDVEQVSMVGDNLERDIAGAQSLGIRTV
jgi:putative hydrolase of the HAD superfamily